MRRAVVRPVVDVGPAQRAGIEAVLIFVGRAGNDGAIKLGVCSLTLTSYPPLPANSPVCSFTESKLLCSLSLLALKFAEPLPAPIGTLIPPLIWVCSAS